MTQHENAFIIDEKDTVAIVKEPVLRGQAVCYHQAGAQMILTALDDIPIYHKVAICDMKPGDQVIKYGEIIGYATAAITAGAHVHTQNLSDLVRKG